VAAPEHVDAVWAAGTPAFFQALILPKSCVVSTSPPLAMRKPSTPY